MTETNRLTKEQALALFDGNQAALGRSLGVTRQAINKLPPGEMPEWMDLKIRFVIKPGAFGASTRERHRPTAASAGATAEAAEVVLTRKAS